MTKQGPGKQGQLGWVKSIRGAVRLRNFVRASRMQECFRF